MKELKIDKELQELFPALSEEEYAKLEQSIVTKGFDKRFPIVIWHGYIADGHNRYSVCKKHNIEFTTEELDCETKDDVISWMMDIQMSRRNLSKVQKIIAVEKYRPVYERWAKERQLSGLVQNQNAVTQNLAEREIQDFVTQKIVEGDSKQRRSDNETNAILAKMAGVNRETYRQAVVVLNSDNDEIKNQMISGEKTISFCYKRLRQLQRKAESKEKSVIEPVKVQSEKCETEEPVVVDMPVASSDRTSSGIHKAKSVEEIADELLQDTKPKKGTELEWCKELSKKYISLMRDNLITTSSRTYAENVTKILDATVENLHKIEKEYNLKPKNTEYVPRPRTGIDAIVGDVFEEEIMPKKEEIDVSDKYPYLQDAPDNLHWDDDDSCCQSDEDTEQSQYDWLDGMDDSKWDDD